MAVSGNEKLSPWIWVALSVLILLALAVIFVLPRVVEQYELPLVNASNSHQPFRSMPNP